VATIKIRLRCLAGSKFADLSLDSLRFFLDGDSQLTYPLYEMLFNSVCEVHIKAVEGKSAPLTIRMPASSLHPAGFGGDEALLPYPSRSFQGYRLLQEYFAFPQKFLFFDLKGLNSLTAPGFGDTVEVSIHLDRLLRLEQPINANTFRLGCTPIINLFRRIAEPIRWNHAQTEYHVVPDVRRSNSTEVYSIDGVCVTMPDMPEAITYEPFYSFKHHGSTDQRRPFWHAVRRPSERKGDNGTELYLSLVDLDFQPTRPASETVMVHTTCINRDLPGKLPFGGDRGDFELEGVASPVSRIRCLVKPTETLRIPIGGGLQWRLISHLSLNYVSISQGGEEALREMLALYNFSDSPATRQQIAGIVHVSSQQVVRRLANMAGNGFCRGVQITMEFDEERYVGSGVFLFASVLEQFLGLYASINSFSQLIATSRQRKEPVRQWPPRSGAQILL
jgi:type VI secretion system protein ImpG